jgi:hypothetical protein
LKIFYVLYADLKPGKGIKISETGLILYVANNKTNLKQKNVPLSEISNTIQLDTCDNIFSDLDPYSQITQVKIYEVSNNSVLNLKKALFVVFKTTSEKDGERWWSLDRNEDYIVLQRSRSLDAVTKKFGSQERKNLKINIQDLVGKGSIKDLLTILWIHQVMEEFNLSKSSNNQSFVTLVSKAITKIGDKDNLAHQSDGNPETLDSFNTLVSGISKWHPLFLPIY